MTSAQFNILLEKWINQQMTETELNSFLSALSDDQYQQLIAGALDKDLAAGNFGNITNAEQRKAAYEQLLQQIIRRNSQPPVHRVHFLKTSWFRYAAAVIILVGGAAVWYELSQRPQSSSSPQAGISQSTNNDIAPGTNRAILTVGNKTIDLATNKTGIAVNNVISYNDGEKIADAGELLQLTTPRGGQYQAILPDGSKVWLNAASAIKFPSKFTGNTREVEITGEAYLEVAKNSKQPFYVHTNKTTVQVLGTSFNVNAYEDEEVERTTLISGSVRIMTNITPSFRRSEERATEKSPNTQRFLADARNDDAGVILKPNQQAELSNTNTIKVNNNADINQVVAWRSGLFRFNRADIKTVMRQLSRWYNVEVKYEGTVTSEEFIGGFQRNIPLSKVIEYLKENNIHVKLEGNTLIVLP